MQRERHIVVPVGHADLGTVLIPDELGGRITTATATDELHALTTSQCVARRVALNVWRTRWICKRMQKNKNNMRIMVSELLDMF